MLLIGSRSLSTHVCLDRQPADWDICIRTEEFSKIQNIYPHHMFSSNHCLMLVGADVVELHIVSPADSCTSASLLRIAEQHNYPVVSTPIGLAYNACPSMHKILKLSTHGILDKSKHHRDLDLLEDVDIRWPDILERRRQEVLIRKQNKERFFKSNVCRFIDHDQLHVWVAYGLALEQPTYIGLVADDVEIVQQAFEGATSEQQCMAIVEEAIVLAIERWFLFHVQKQNVFRLWDRLLRAHTSTDPCIRWLDKLCIPGALQDHPDWLAHWCQEHYPLLKTTLQQSLKTISKTMPKQFWHFIDLVKKKQIQPV